MCFMDLLQISIIALTFLLAGGVKGVIGLGLPTVSLGLLVTVFDLTTAMALLLAPSLVTNIWQAMTGGNGLLIVRRIWLFLLVATAFVWIGSKAFVALDNRLMTVLLGVLLISYSLISLWGIRLTISSQRERPMGIVLGAINGVLTGMTGSFVVPGVMYLQAIGLPRDQLVQAMGMLFAMSTIGLALALQNNNLLTSDLSIYSALAVIPAIIGMVLGQRIRMQLSETMFRKVFYIGILLLGSFIVAKSVLTVSA